MKKSMFLFMSIVFALNAESAYADKQFTHRINTDELTFVLESDENDGTAVTEKIIVKDANGKVIQTLVTSEFNGGESVECPSDALELEFYDMNFDGFDDMRIQAFSSAGANIPYVSWLWDDSKKQFVYDEALSAIASPEIDAQNKWILSSTRNSASNYRDEFYKYIDGKLTLFKAIDKEYLDDDTIETVTFEMNKNGELAETARENKKAE